MKKVMFALLALVLSASVVSVASASVFVNTVVELADEKVKIKPEELPDAIKTALNCDDYMGWQINAAYKYTDLDQYEVELKNGEELITLKFDKEGNKID